jgi:hypothetical protein
MFLVKDPEENITGLTWTALDVGGPCVETFGIICDHGSRSEFLNLGHPSCGGLGKPTRSGVDFQIGGLCLAIGCHIQFNQGESAPLSKSRA